MNIAPLQDVVSEMPKRKARRSSKNFDTYSSFEAPRSIVQKKITVETKRLEQRIESLGCSVFDMNENVRVLSVMNEVDYQTGFISTWGLGTTCLIGDGPLGLALQEKRFSELL